ncbi:uncharacterized protein FOMMEDRAFT_26470 [Fomitiporia mediterranea MF3/22]|uniref:uncharacterized protein n=1 Tax=Fomitiporia mediterranea (strain MF3/22) TaxID=694068 RepID=UPI0004408B3A|nr:uncharacterized protein FOMMEDRAFT_26470 [Fomitiporia mediterranea MF3/22]EJD05582.1 hypothetical protein FOMMEDRAFT_26470 [Fomitiporia mediterranea MF3/22]
MLSTLGWQTVPLPFGKKAQIDAHKQPGMSYASRPKTAQAQPRAAQAANPTYYLVSSSSSNSYMLDSQRPSSGIAGQSSVKAPSSYMPPPAVHQKTSTTGDRGGPRNTSPSRSYKIYPDTPMLDVFVYERSEADSDTLTCYSNSSVDTLLQFPITEQTKQVSPPATARRNSTMLIKDSNAATNHSAAPPAPGSPHPPPMSLPISSTAASQVHPLSRGSEEGPRPRSGSGDSGSSGRRNSVSEPERPVILPQGPSSARSSPPRTSPTGSFPDRTNVPPTFTSGPRDVLPARRNSDPITQAEMSRQRRLSGAVIPTGFGVLPGERLSPPNRRDSMSIVPAGLGTTDRHPPLPLRGAPSPDGKRDRASPDREVSPTSAFARERRVNGGGIDVFPPPPPGSFYDRDRPPLRRGSQSSNSTSSRERHSPQDEAPRGVAFTSGPVLPIRSRTLSQGRLGKDEVPRPIIVAGLEQSKVVRFSETLICPSPIPHEKRRKGWFNKRGDQLWTNDGVFVAPDPGTEYPIDLADYPEVGVGWQNEEGIRIDMEHRLIPKVPLRPALKRGGSSASSQPHLQQQAGPPRPEFRSAFSTTIREEA